MKMALDIAQIASCLHKLGENCWRLALFSGMSAAQNEQYKLMSTPRVGDLVMEVSTIRRRKNAIDGVGILMKISPKQPSGFKKWTIKTLDGRKMVWTNCHFIKLCHVETKKKG